MNNEVIDKLELNFTVPVLVYDLLGNKILSNNEKEFGENFYFNPPDIKSFKNGIFKDGEKNRTYFLINHNSVNLYGVLKGVDETSTNFAYILSNLLERVLEEKNDNRKPSVIKDFLLGKYKESPEKIKEELMLGDEAILILIKSEIKNIGEIYNFLTQFSSEKDIFFIIEEDKLLYIKFNDEENNFDNAQELAILVKESIKIELLINVFVSVGEKTENFKELPYAYHEAECAMKMGLMSGDINVVFTFKEYLLMQIIDKLNKDSLQEYLDALIPKNMDKFFSNYELIYTAQEFLNNDLNLSETSRNAFLHKNTLLYRLDKIEKLTGLNIKRFSDALYFKLAYVIYKVLNGKDNI